MIDAFYTAATGVSAMQKGMDIVANNIANANTQGFKSSKASFADLVYTNIHEKEGDSKLKNGHGSAVVKSDVLHNQSGIIGTDRTLDFALVSDGFFAIETLNGTKYTRQGDFNMVKLGNKFYLADSEGGYVLDPKGKRIEIKESEIEVVDDSNTGTGDGTGTAVKTKTVRSGVPDQVAPLNVGVFTFANNDALNIEGKMYFSETEASGKPIALKASDEAYKRAYLENSNTDMAQSMADVITLQRSFQFNTRMVQMADEVMQTVNALR